MSVHFAFKVIHSMPGRVRLRIPQTRDNQALAESIADVLLSKPGVTGVRMNVLCASMVVIYDTSKLRTFLPERWLTGYTFDERNGRSSIVAPNSGSEGKLGRARMFFKRFASLIIPTAAFAFSLFRHALPIAPVYGLVAAAAAPVFRRAISTVRREKRLGVDFLDATALAIMGIQRNLPTCGFMAWLISVGEHIREETARKSEKAIADLLSFHCSFATVLRGRRRVKMSIECLVAGDRVVVNAGDIIPVDGVVVRGRAGIDQMSLTGESVLLDRCAGDGVFAGSVAVDGELVIEARAVGLDTRAGRIVQMLRSAPAQDTKIEDYAARFADRLVLPTFAMSGMVFAWSRSLTRALSMLIVDFGTGVRVAAPTAFLSFMTYAAQKNIVIKGGRAMEKLAAVDTVIFDKTGTLTTGLPEVKDVVVVNRRFSKKGVLRLAAAAEAGLNHPVANALTASAAELGVRLPAKVGARLRIGLGVKAEVEGRRVVVGSERLMEEEEVETTTAQQFVPIWTAEAKSPLFVAVDGKLAGVITCADRVRPESARVVQGLKNLGLTDVIMVTGDRDEVAQATSRVLGIDQVISEVFPEKKLEVLRRLQKAGRTVAVVGDGMNDSLALAHADVAIAPASATDAAKEAADLLLMEDDLRLIIEAFIIARSAVRLVRQNFGIVAFPNAGALALAASGLLGPPGATFINNGSTVAAALNGLRPLLRKARNGAARVSQNSVCTVEAHG